MNEFSAYGLWSLVAINSLVFIVFAFSFTRPKSPRDWRSFGAFSAFLVALFTEMYGFPLTIYLFSGWLSARFPQVDWFAHDSGHLLEMLFGWGGDPHAGPFHLLSAVFIFGGFILLAWSWRVLYRAQRARTMAMSGPYSLVRHPQYTAFISIMFGFLLQWPTLLTLLMFPVLVYMYLRLAQREERDAFADFGEEYRSYLDRTPAFLPRFRDTLRLTVVACFIFAVPVAIVYLVVPDRNTTADRELSETGGGRAGENTPMGKDMSIQRLQVGTLKKQMQDLGSATDPALRRDLIQAHFSELRRINATLHEMNRKMIEEVDKGRIVSETGLKQRLQLDADVMNMQLEMLEGATNAGDASGVDSSIKPKSKQG
ncbi:MAG: isoprenylcysteine carboxylmethyltransferase family protein [Burkholderiales bacterium]|nr:isoprenylcysteine carboxylmethyltransferase family protein [Burkholderiales bacterium]